MKTKLISKTKQSIAQQILTRIISKGGIMGCCANLYFNDPIKTVLFIKECAEQCHNQQAIDLWGEELVSDIVKFSQGKCKFIIEKQKG